MDGTLSCALTDASSGEPLTLALETGEAEAVPRNTVPLTEADPLGGALPLNVAPPLCDAMDDTVPAPLLGVALAEAPPAKDAVDNDEAVPAPLLALTPAEKLALPLAVAGTALALPNAPVPLTLIVGLEVKEAPPVPVPLALTLPLSRSPVPDGEAVPPPEEAEP